jgi:hypothetical protein
MEAQEKNDVGSLLDEFVSLMWDMANKLEKSVMDVRNAFLLIPDIHSMDDDQVLAALVSAREAYHSPIDKEIELAKSIINNVRKSLVKGSSIQLLTHEKRIEDLEDARAWVKRANKIAMQEVSEEPLSYYKVVEEVVGAYRILLFEFNACIIEYNRLNPESPLSPLVFTDVSPARMDSDKKQEGMEAPESYWNYRVLEETKNGIPIFRIIEVYYKDGNISGWVDNTATILEWEDYDYLKGTWELLKHAFDKPILKRGEKDYLYEKK